MAEMSCLGDLTVTLCDDRDTIASQKRKLMHGWIRTSMIRNLLIKARIASNETEVRQNETN